MNSSCMTTAHSAPIGVMWKTVSEDCNLACDYCYYSRVGGKINGRIKRIDSAVLEKFIREYMSMSNGVASFVWQGGEPLLAGKEFFKEVVALQAYYAPPNTIISNAVQTNATLIDEEWARFFKRFNFLVGVSLDGPQDIHDARRVTHSGVGSFKRVMRGIEHLRHHNVDFNILTVLHEGNVTHVKDLFEFYERESFEFLQFIPCMDFRAQETEKPPTYLISPQQYGDFLCQAFDLWYNDGEPRMSVRFFDNMLSVYLNQGAELCIHQRVCPTTLILEQNGDAFPCDFYISDTYKLGNVATDSLQDIIGNYVFQSFMDKKPKLPSKCKSCTFIELCHGGCPRNRRWGETPDGVDVDYFCESYLQLYRYAENRMSRLAQKIRTNNLGHYLLKGNQEPAPDETCFCGSGLKYKKCCGTLRPRIPQLKN